jgi:myo-inositol-1(or 4)-monophosphatase
LRGNGKWSGGGLSKELVECALLAARSAAAVHRSYLGRVAVEEWSEKGVADFVTHVDREAESGIVAAILQQYPDHRILAEESQPETAASVAEGSFTWIIDPLDGTTNFLHGYPMYAVSIAAVQGGHILAGVVVNSASGEEWTAVHGGGAFRNGVRVQVSGIDRLSRALIGTGFPFKALHLLPGYTRQLEATLRATSGVRRAGSAALDLCHVASGYFDGFWELSLAPWDVAAGALIVREAEGIITRVDGSADVLGHGSILAGNAAIHAALGTLINGIEHESAA